MSCWFEEGTVRRFPFPESLPCHDFALVPGAAMLLVDAARASRQRRAGYLAKLADGTTPGIYCMRCGVSVSEAVLLAYMQPYGFPCGTRILTVTSIADSISVAPAEAAYIHKVLRDVDEDDLKESRSILAAGLLAGKQRKSVFPVMCMKQNGDYGVAFIET
jgi:hypothetical protein